MIVEYAIMRDRYVINSHNWSSDSCRAGSFKSFYWFASSLFSKYSTHNMTAQHLLPRSLIVSLDCLKGERNDILQSNSSNHFVESFNRETLDQSDVRSSKRDKALEYLYKTWAHSGNRRAVYYEKNQHVREYKEMHFYPKPLLIIHYLKTTQNHKMSYQFAKYLY